MTECCRQEFLMFLPPNITALVQPMDQSIIEKLKCMYKMETLHRVLLTEEEETIMLSFSKQLSLKDCCYMIADLWNMFTLGNLKKGLEQVATT